MKRKEAYGYFSAHKGTKYMIQTFFIWKSRYRIVKIMEYIETIATAENMETIENIENIKNTNYKS